MDTRKQSCKFCGKIDHTTFNCYEKPKAKLKKGKQDKQWVVTRRTWFKANPAEHYTCYICGKWLFPNQVTLDHIKSRGRYPELRYVLSNLAPCCYKCNVDKGSKEYNKDV